MLELNTKIDYLQDNKSFVQLVDKMEIDAAPKVVNAARQSYGAKSEEFLEKDKKLTGFLWNEEHTSPFRHTYFTLNIRAPLFLFNQLKKYQVGSVFRSFEIDGENVRLDLVDHFYDTDKGCSWNELSGRYKQTSTEFYIPKELRSNPPHGNKQASSEYLNPLSEWTADFMYPEEILFEFESHCRESLFLYNQMIKNGVAKEIARMIMPQNIYTEASWTVSLQAMIHFLHQRLKPDAQWEIRQLAEGVYSIFKPILDKLGLSKEDL